MARGLVMCMIMYGGRPEPPPRAPRVPPSTAGPSQPVEHSVLSDTHYRRLTRRMDAMHDVRLCFAQDLTQALSSAFRASSVEVEWPVFGAGMVYPPPDSPSNEDEESDPSASF